MGVGVARIDAGVAVGAGADVGVFTGAGVLVDAGAEVGVSTGAGVLVDAGAEVGISTGAGVAVGAGAAVGVATGAGCAGSCRNWRGLRRGFAARCQRNSHSAAQRQQPKAQGSHP